MANIQPYKLEGDGQADSVGAFGREGRMSEPPPPVNLPNWQPFGQGRHPLLDK